MRSRAKGFYWRQLPQNHFQYRFCLSSGLPDIVWALQLESGAVLKKQQEIASTKVDGKEERLTMPFSGKVIKIEDFKESSKQELFLLEKCQHLPIQGTSKIEICQICGDELLSYEDKQEIAFRKRDFKQIKNLEAPVEWNVVLNQQFFSGKVLGTCGEDELVLEFIGRVVYINNPKDRQEIILKVRKTICLHEKVKDNICLQCHAYVEVEKTSLTAQTNGVVSSGRLLQKLEAQFVNKLKVNKRLLLILDLDNTLIHAIENYPGDEITFQNDECLIIQAYPIRYLVKFRPFMRQFLEKVLPKFDIYIYTKGTRIYAEKICEHFRKLYGDLMTSPEYDDFFTPKRITSRDEDASLTRKSLEKIIKNHEGIIVILDDRKDVWQQCRKNVVNTRFYKHYQRFLNKITIIPATDHYFYYTTPFLMTIHETFFNQQPEKQDVRSVIKMLQKQRLAGVKAYFLNQNLRLNPIYCRAINLGISDVGDWTKTEPNIFIYSSSYTHKDRQTIRQKNIPVIHELWIDFCYLQNYRFKWDMFDVSKEDHISDQTILERANFELKLFEAHKIQ